MKTDNFTVVAFSDDMILSARLAKVCSDLGCALLLPDAQNENLADMDIKRGVFIIDLNGDSDEPVKQGKTVKSYFDLPLFGVMNRLDHRLREQARISGFDMVFPRAGFVRNLALIIRQSIEGGDVD